MRAEGNLLAGCGGEDTRFQESNEVCRRLHTHVIVKGKDEGIPTTTQGKAAVVITTKTHGRKAEGERSLGMPGSELPKDGFQQEARGNGFLAGAAASFSRGCDLL